MFQKNRKKHKFSNFNSENDNQAFEGSKQNFQNEAIELKSEEPTDIKKEISLIEIFKYGDTKDKILLIIGCIAAFGSACVYPLMFFLYGKVASTLIDQEKLNRLNSTNISTSLFNNNSWYFYLYFLFLSIIKMIFIIEKFKF